MDDYTITQELVTEFKLDDIAEPLWLRVGQYAKSSEHS